MRKAMSIMGFTEDEQVRVMKIVAAVLHMGNLSFRLKHTTDENAPDAAQLNKESQEVADLVSRLLEVDSNAFTRSLTNRKILAGRELLNVELTPMQAEVARDALAKAAYGSLFLWIVQRINKAIDVGEDPTPTAGNGQFAFETWERLSF